MSHVRVQASGSGEPAAASGYARGFVQYEFGSENMQTCIANGSVLIVNGQRYKYVLFDSVQKRLFITRIYSFVKNKKYKVY